MSSTLRWSRFCLLLCASLLLQARAYAELHAPFYEAARGKQVVYVLGTLHVGRPDFYPLRPAIESALGKSTRLYLEIRLDDPAAQQKLAQAMICDHPCLKEALTESEWDTLTVRLEQQEAAIRNVSHIRPWAAAVVLTMGDFAALGLSPQQGLEEYVSGRAGAGKEAIGLETVDEQIRLFTGMPQAAQKEMLGQWLNMTLEERLAMSRKLVTLWENGDADLLHAWYRNMEKQYSSNPDVAEAFDRQFLVMRNRILVDRLLSQIGSEAGPFFLAVGALHLGGPGGVLALLQKHGFQVNAR